MTIPGLVYSDTAPTDAPHVLVIAREKTGKSTLATTLEDWPGPGKKPLVLAIDPSGVDSARRIGKSLAHFKVRDEPGETFKAKIRNVVEKLETYLVGKEHNFGAIVVDDASTLADRLFDEEQRYSSNPNPKAHYGEILNACSSLYFRLTDLGLPIIWIAWLREPEKVTEKGTSVLIPGGPHILGSFREKLAGRVHAIVMLDKVIARPDDPRASSDGFIRKLHTRPFRGINCESRYALPNPMKAHLGWLLHYIQNGYDPQDPHDQGGAL